MKKIVGAVSGVPIVLLAIAMMLGLLIAGSQTSPAPSLTPQLTADTSLFTPGYIISDQVFFNSGAMSQAAIQQFLQQQEAGCQAGYTCLKDWRDTSRNMPADAMCGAYTGAPNELASTIIAKVALACGINPQVILVTLQKEQGLVTHTWPSTWRYTIAMGQGCPDTAGCDTNYYGFFNQVYGAAWYWKRYANPPGTSNYFNWFTPGKTWSVLYNPDPKLGCGSSPVLIQNQATADLYYYTPYQPNAAAIAAGYGLGDSCSSYGNRNFFNYFTDWFGSPNGIPAIYQKWQQWGGASGQLGNLAGIQSCGLAQGGCSQHFANADIYWSPASGAWVVRGALWGGWMSQGSVNGFLGYPVSDEGCGLDSGGCVQAFQGGDLVYSPASGTVPVKGAIWGAWAADGRGRGALGIPTASENCGATPGVCTQAFTKGQIVYSAATGAQAVTGSIASRWSALGGPASSVGLPTAPAVCSGSGVCSQQFQNAVISSSPSAGTWKVDGAIWGAWTSQGGASGTLGLPTGDEACQADGRCVQQFQGGAVSWLPGSGAWVLSGAVLGRWTAIGGVSSPLGSPTSPLSCTIVRQGCYQHFQGGDILYSPASGAWDVKGQIWGRWAATGFQSGPLGYPISGESCGLTGGGCTQNFEGAVVAFSPATGAWPVRGANLTHWQAIGAQSGPLGYPLNAEDCTSRPGWCVEHFQYGDMVWTQTTWAYSVRGAIYGNWLAQINRLGPPLADEQCTGSGPSLSCTQSFSGGKIIWQAGSGVSYQFS